VNRTFIGAWIVGQFQSLAENIPIHSNRPFGQDSHTRGMATKRLPRPGDPIQLGKLVVDIGTGQIEDRLPEPLSCSTKNPSAVTLGRLGGK
jgi:hypothetical protein